MRSGAARLELPACGACIRWLAGLSTGRDRREVPCRSALSCRHGEASPQSAYVSTKKIFAPFKPRWAASPDGSSPDSFIRRHSGDRKRGQTACPVTGALSGTVRHKRGCRRS